MDTQKYEIILREINIEIEKFNLLLADNFKISPLVTYGESWFPTVGVPYEKISHPFNNLPGVYILCACCQNDSLRVGAYIGKSSGARVAIGWRLDAHFRPGKATNRFTYLDSSGVPYIIEAISAIGLRDPRMRTIAPALEEFIISGVKERVHLLNRSGNWIKKPSTKPSTISSITG